MRMNDPLVYIVDDDEAVRDSLHMLFRSVGIQSCTHANAESFLADYDPQQVGCVVLDIRMPGMDGFDLLMCLNAKSNPPPVIMMSGHGDIRLAVDTVHAGAIDFLEKPLRERDILERVQQGIKYAVESHRHHTERSAIQDCLSTLSVRESEILELVIAGMSNKAIAVKLGISHKTVESHRTNIMRKTRAQTIPDLIRIVSTANADRG